MITLTGVYTPIRSVSVGDVYAYDANIESSGANCSYIVVVRAPDILKKNNKVYGVAISRAPGVDDKTIYLEIDGVNGVNNRYIDCSNVIAVESYRLGFKAGMVNEDCINAIFDLLCL